MSFYEKNYEGKQRFGLRKLTVGVCSVLLSTLIMTAVDQPAHADTNGTTSQESASSASSQSQSDPNRGFKIVSGASSATQASTASESTQQSAASSASDQSQASGAETAQSGKSAAANSTASNADGQKSAATTSSAAAAKASASEASANSKTTTAKAADQSEASASDASAQSASSTANQSSAAASEATKQSAATRAESANHSATTESEASEEDKANSAASSQSNASSTAAKSDNTSSASSADSAAASGQDKSDATETLDVNKTKGDDSSATTVSDEKTASGSGSTDSAASDSSNKAKAASTTTTNGGFDKATWGTLDVSKWTGQDTVFNGTHYYQLTGYTGDKDHIIVPNEADFEAAGKSTGGLQVSIAKNLITSWRTATSIAFSKTDNKKIKFAGTDLMGNSGGSNNNNSDEGFAGNSNLTNLDANSLDVSSVTSLNHAFSYDTKLMSFAGISDWDVSNVTSLNAAFANDKYTSLAGLENWNVSNVKDMSYLCTNSDQLTDISALANWDTSSATDMNRAFNVCHALASLHGLENWNTSKVTNLNAIFANEYALTDASAIASWDTSNVTDMGDLFTNSNPQYIDFSKWNFSKVTNASNVIHSSPVVYLGNNNTITTNNMSMLGLSNFSGGIILASGNLYTALSGVNKNTHTITMSNSDSLPNITVPVVYDAGSASNMTDAITSYKNMVDAAVKKYADDHPNYVMTKTSASVDDLTGHNNHLVNYAEATYTLSHKTETITDPTQSDLHQTRTIVVHYIDATTGKALAEDAKLNVFYSRTGTKDLVTGKFISYGNWTWDTSQGDTTTPGYHIVSGNWVQLSKNSSQIIQADIPTIDGYTSFKHGNWEKNNDGSITNPSADEFTYPGWYNVAYTDNAWLYEATPVHTIYYLANSLVQKTITRTINVTKPGETSPTTTTQTATLTKTPTITGTGAVTYSDWTTDDTSWAAMTPDAVNGYTPKITQTVNGKTSTINSIAAQPVDSNTQPTTIDVTYKSNTQTGTINYVDADGNVIATQSLTGTTGSTVAVKSVVDTNIPKGWEITSGQTIPDTVTATATGIPTQTVKIQHKIDNITQTQVRTATVHYINATDGSQIAPDAVLDIYYTRTATQDEVTGTITPKGVWLWDSSKNDDGYTNGYKVVSGNWTTHAEDDFANIEADLPSISGYTALTNGDWTMNSNGQQTTVPANQFVHPTWNTAGKNGQTLDGSESFAYTTDAAFYEARPEHTVYYVPVDTMSRTITEHYVAIDGYDSNNQPITHKVADDAQLQIFFKQTASGLTTGGSKTPSDWKITYGAWNWDPTQGDSATPGFHVILGTWSLTKPGTTASIGAAAIGAPSGYTAAALSSDPHWFSTPTLISRYSNLFTNNTDMPWYNRNELTTYYVADTLLSKTVTRTINITDPVTGKTTTTQQANLTRTAKINDSDTGVTYSDWSTDANSWTAVDIAKAGYTPHVTIDGQSTTDTGIAAQTVDGTTENTTIDVTYSATATATLAGNGSSTYSGSAITWDEINKDIKANITGPTATSGTYTFKQGDLQFSTDGNTWTTDLPTNAGTYQVQLTQQGITNIEKQFGNSAITWTSAGGSATYTINKASSTASLANTEDGNYTQVYNGAAVSSIDPTKFTITATLNGTTVTLNTDGIDSSSYEWVDASGNSISNPENVGTYRVKLTDPAFKQLQTDNPNFDLTSNTGLGTFTITQAEASATLSGSGTRAYNGSAVSVADLNASDANNNITLTLHYPVNGNADYSTTVQLTADDFVWNTSDGKAPVDANSQADTIGLNTSAIEKLIQEAVGTGQNSESNVTFADDAINGTASYTITPLASQATVANASEGNYSKVYDAQGTSQIDPSKLTITTTLNGKSVALDMTGLTGSDFEWVDANGKPLTTNPTDAGTYYIKFKDTGLTTLQADNPNYALTINNDSFGVYTITPAAATASLTGSNSKTYDGQAITLDEINSTTGNITVNLNYPGANSQTYTLQNGDYTISGNATDAGTYTITLTDQGVKNVEDAIAKAAGSGNVTFATDAVNGSATFTINKAKNNVYVSGTQTETYTGSPISVSYNADGTNSVTVQLTNPTSGGIVGTLTNLNLDSSDFEIVDNAGKPTTATNAGSYRIILTADGLKKVQAAAGDNFEIR